MLKFNAEFYKITAANFLFFIGFSFFILFPVFLKDIGATESFIGIMNGFDKISIIVTAFFIGAFIAGRDRLLILRTGYVIMIIVSLLHLFITDPTVLIALIRIAHGAGFAVALTLVTTMIFETVPSHRAASAIGIFGITGAMSGAISPLAAETLLNQGYTFDAIFILSAVSISAALGLSFFIKIDPPDKKPDSAPAAAGILSLIKIKRVIPIAAVTFIFGGGFGIIITFFPNFILTTTELAFSSFFLSYITTLILVRVVLVDAFAPGSKKELIVTAFATGSAMFFILYFLDNLPVLLLAGAMYGIAHGILYPVLNTYMVEAAGFENRERSNSLYIAMFNAGMMAFSATLGFAVDASGSYMPAFFTAGTIFILAIIVTSVFLHNIKN